MTEKEKIVIARIVEEIKEEESVLTKREIEFTK